MRNSIDTIKDDFKVGPIMHRLISLVEKYEERLTAIKKDDTKAKFKLAEKVIKERNSKMISVMKSEYPLMKHFDITGGMRFSISALEGESDPVRRYFLSGDHTRSGADMIFSRGPSYYFRYPGIELKKKPNKKGFEVEGFESKIYFESMKNQLSEIDALLGVYKEKKVSDLTGNDRLIMLTLLEHKKNIISFLMNITNILSDRSYLSESINAKLIFTPQEGNSLKDRDKVGFQRYRAIADGLNKNKLLEYYYSVEKSYLSLLLGKQTGGEYPDIKLNATELDEDGRKYLKKVAGSSAGSGYERDPFGIDDSFALIEGYFDFFNNAVSGMRGSNRQIFIKKSISKLVRHQREEDNPWNMLLSSLLIIKRLIDEKKLDDPIEIYGILYGGMEFAFVLKYLIEGFKSKNSHLTDILLYNFSLYDLKNADDKKEKDEYPFSQSDFRKLQKKTILRVASILDEAEYDEEKIENCLSIILDDNIHSGETIFRYLDLVKSNNKFPAVSSMFLDRDSMRYDGGNVSGADIFDEMLTSQISMISSRLPINADGKDYRNTINLRIERVLKN